ncbi:MAG: tRNA 2-thiouridine(34) synthase MnmA [Ilumatobacter sp.]|uniref:tRNA 2-thiouridine(34) synthase MnmA n=1 Tax=Ilumatobacter sp. TaxID=1967498 RepID=UPI003C757A22
MKVMCAMSGGVDSSVAALLLKEAGHEVVGVTMKLWGGSSDTGCCSVSDVDDARRVAQQLDIDHLVFNFGEDFDTHVVEPYVEAHANGTTPNPCIECNREVKFARLAERAELLGFDAVATGHHAAIGTLPDGTLTLERGHDTKKDQSYVVHMLDQAQLARTMFPVGGMDKSDVRARAAEIDLRTADKPDSQDVCFITKSDGRESFLGDRIPFRRADVVDMDGARVGTVESVEMVTIGQRKGLGLPGGGPKKYVVDVDVAQQVVTIGDDADLLRPSLDVTATSWVAEPVDGEVRVQCSAHGRTQLADVSLVDGVAHVEWREPQRRIAPGQSVVFYDATDRRVLGGGICR